MKSVVLSVLTLFFTIVATHEASAINRASMSAQCNGQVAGRYATRLIFVKTLKIEKAKDGSMSIRGTVDKGIDGIETFKCLFDKRGNLINVRATTSHEE